MNKIKLYRILGGIGLAGIVVVLYCWFMPDMNWQGVKVHSGETQLLKLPDSSTVYLVGPSQIGYPKVFDKKVRSVKISGEVHFNIKLDPTRTFLVQSEKGGVETYGSKFIINTTKNKNITVYCLEQQLRMIARGKKKIFEIPLDSYEFCSFNKGDGDIMKEKVDSTTIHYFTK